MRNPKIFREEAKDRHTSHWDLDCMTTRELEAAIEDAANQPVPETTSVAGTSSAECVDAPWWRRAMPFL